MASTRDYTKPDSKINAFKDEYSDLDVMFVAHPISGDIAIKKDSEAVKRSVRNILLTNNYERPFKPNFGANLRARLFGGLLHVLLLLIKKNLFLFFYEEWS